MNSSIQINIVDAERVDYAALQPWLESGEIHVRFLHDARSALRSARQGKRTLWIVSLDLPDGGGIELSQMLSAICGAPIYAVSRHHDPELERAVRTSCGAAYLCKPLQFDWLGQLCRALPQACQRPNRRRSNQGRRPPVSLARRYGPVPTLSFGGVRLPVEHWRACF